MNPTDVQTIWNTFMTSNLSLIIQNGLVLILVPLAGLLSIVTLYLYVHRWLVGRRMTKNTFFMVETESFKRRNI